MRWKGKKLIIADPDVAVVKLLNSALKDSEMKIFNVKDGPRALELAVSCQPDLIILEIALPFLNGIRIAQILKSNPNVKNVPIIFMTAGEINPAYLSFLENSVIKKPININEVMARIDASLLKIAKAIEVQGESKEVQGSLAQMPIVDILQIFNINKKEGVLILQKETEEGMIFLSSGKILNAVIGPVKGEKALYRLLSWTSGSFDYIPKNFNPEICIDKPTDALLMEGMRQLDEWNRMENEFPPMDANLYLKIKPKQFPGKLRPVTKEVLALVEFYKKISDILDNSSHPDFEVMITIHTLISKGMLDCKQKEVKKKQKQLPLLTSEEAFAIKERLKAPFRETYEMDTVKIPILAHSIEEIKKVTNLLKELDDFVVEKSFFSEKGPKIPFGPMGTIRASENITILFHAFPCGNDYLPLWPPFMGDSIGMILLRGKDKVKCLSRDIERLQSAINVKPVIINVANRCNEKELEGMLQINLMDVETEETRDIFHSILRSFLELS